MIDRIMHGLTEGGIKPYYDNSYSMSIETVFHHQDGLVGILVDDHEPDFEKVFDVNVKEIFILPVAMPVVAYDEAKKLYTITGYSIGQVLEENRWYNKLSRAITGKGKLRVMFLSPYAIFASKTIDKNTLISPFYTKEALAKIESEAMMYIPPMF